MIEAEFIRYSGALVGFSITGHANSGPFGKDIVCAGVSSAAMLTVNTITDFLYCPCDVKVEENRVLLVVKDPDAVTAISAKQMIASFAKHMELLAADKKGKIKITVKEVKSRKGQQS